MIFSAPPTQLTNHFTNHYTDSFAGHSAQHPIFDVSSLQGRGAFFDPTLPLPSPDHPSSESSGSRRIEPIGQFEGVIAATRMHHEPRFELSVARGAAHGVNPRGDEVLRSVFGRQGAFPLMMEEMVFEHLEAAFEYGADVQQWAKLSYSGKDVAAWNALKARSSKNGTVGVCSLQCGCILMA